VTTARTYQAEGIRLIHEVYNHRALLADDPGLGKTFQALTVASQHWPRGNIVVICPASVKLHWQKEAKTHVGMRAEVLYGRTPPTRPVPKAPRIWVLNYDILGRARDENTWVKFLKRLDPVGVILDEGQKVKDARTIAFKSVRVLLEGIPRVLILTGTPVENMPADVWTMAHLLRPDVPEFGSWPIFARKFTVMVRKPWGWVPTRAKNLPTLHRLLKETILIRRKKADVLKDLPPLTKTVVPFRLRGKEAAEYAEAEADLIAWLKKTHGKRRADNAAKAEQMVKLGYLKRLGAMLRLPQSLDWTDEHMESVGGKIVIFGVGKNLLRIAQDRWRGRNVLVNGSVPVPKRSALVDAFKRDPKVTRFLGNIRAAGIGMDGLQYAASQIALFELDFNPACLEQALGRVDRLGQTEPVYAHIHVTEDTVEPDLLELVQKKVRVSSAVLDGEASADWDLYDALAERLLERGKK
jgi:SWI/SNF-related matrix-associated actin-dependent regulator of chromatin subfamily A-like protein 1